MLNVNEYFDGQVKSIGFVDGQGKATVGVMAAGEYTFNTGAPEVMVVVRGALTVQLADQEGWTTYSSGDRFDVPGNSSFRLQVKESTAYLCEYE